MAMIDLFSLPVVAMTAYMEASGEGYRGMRAVVAVIRNRARRREQLAWQVCLDPKQFSAWNSANDPNRERLVVDAVHDPVFQDAVRACFDPEDETDGADHYFTVHITPPSWSESMVETIVLGNHRFFRS